MGNTSPRPEPETLFPTDEPLPVDELIGRRSDVRELAHGLAEGRNLIVVGPRRTGKTSVCLAALEKVRRDGAYAAAVDLWEQPSAAELATALVEQLVANRPAARRLLMRARRAAPRAAEAVALVASLKSSFGEEVEVVFRPQLAERDPDHYLDYALRLPQQIGQADDRRVVVFFDEFQQLASAQRAYGDPDLLTKRMRAIFQHSPRVSLLFAGSAESVMRDIFGRAESGLGLFGGLHDLSPISPDEWRAGLAGRFGKGGVTPDSAALERVIELGEGHPRTTMLLAAETYDLAVLAGLKAIDASLVAEALHRAMRSDRGIHEREREKVMGLGKHALAVARRVAAGLPPYAGSRGRPKAIYTALSALERAGILERRGRGDWHVSDPLFRRYLAEQQR